MRNLQLVLIGALALAAASARAAPPHRLTERAVRAFVARQEALWLRRDFAGFFALAAPEAVFTTERRGADGRVTSERRSVDESRRAAEHAFASIDMFRETAFVDRVDIAPDGRSARIFGHEEAEMVRAGTRRRLCADTEQAVIFRGGNILSLGQTDRVRSCETPPPAGEQESARPPA
jgi:hypothetical protein